MAIIYSFVDAHNNNDRAFLAKLIITGFTLDQEVSKLLLTNYYCEGLET
mgnify:FL=1